MKAVCLVLNYNDAPTTKHMVDSIKEYTVFSNILIVDNASTDNSYDCLKKYFKTNEKIIVVNSGRNGGYGYGNNFGIKYIKNELKADYAIVSNPDVSFSEDTVIDLIKLMKDKNAALTSATQIVNGKKIENPAWKIPTALQWAFAETRFFKKYVNGYHYPTSYFESKYSKVDCVRGAFFLLDVNKFLKVNGYDENMFLFGEETLLGFKLKQNNFDTYILNHEYYYHNHSVTINKNIPSIINQEKIMWQSKKIFSKKYLKTNQLKMFIFNFIFKLKIIKLKVKSYI